MWATLILWILSGSLAVDDEVDHRILPQREGLADPRLAETEYFVLTSHFWLNMHDYLYQEARGRADEKARTRGHAKMGDGERGEWKRALAYYHENMKERHHRTDALMNDLRYVLSERKTGRKLHPQIGEVVEVLGLAADAYALAFWEEHDERNRKWAEELLPRLRAHEEKVVPQLEDLFQHPWPEDKIAVDAVPFASWAGANAVRDPHHVMMSSENPSYRGASGFEMIFHEASHTIVSPGGEAVGGGIVSICEQRKIDAPDGLWHAILFYTVGDVIRELLAEEEGVKDYRPYMYKYGLFNRSWSRYRDGIETHWQAYLDGELTMNDALERLIGGIEKR